MNVNKDILLMTVYINVNFWNNDFERISNLLNEVAGKDNIIVIGDCNARVSNEQIIQSDLCYINNNRSMQRQSKDKQLNVGGKRWLECCEDNNLVILNGRTKGNMLGQFTLIGPMGASVNDLCSVSFSILSIVKDFKVLSEVYSDYCPIALTLNLVNSNESKNATLPLLPKLMWYNNNVKYKEKLDKELEKCKDLGDEPD